MLSRHTHSISILLALIPALLPAACKPGGCQPAGREGVRRIVLSEREREELEKLYDAGILQLDSDPGRLFRFIDERFGFDDTLVIVTSDHTRLS